MREIKFRGKSKNWVCATDSQWAVGLLVNDMPPEIMCDDGDIFSVDPATVGQFTGLCDCKGQDIYEGDVVAFGDFFREHDVENEYWHGVVKWSFESARFVLDELEFDEDVCNDELLVIGNVHDNPNLLEVEHD